MSTPPHGLPRPFLHSSPLNRPMHNRNPGQHLEQPRSLEQQAPTRNSANLKNARTVPAEATWPSRSPPQAASAATAVSTAEASTEAVYAVDLELLLLLAPQQPAPLDQAQLAPPARKALTWAVVVQAANSVSAAVLEQVPYEQNHERGARVWLSQRITTVRGESF
jgi:hypothetical protein